MGINYLSLNWCETAGFRNHEQHERQIRCNLEGLHFLVWESAEMCRIDRPDAKEQYLPLPETKGWNLKITPKWKRNIIWSKSIFCGFKMLVDSGGVNITIKGRRFSIGIHWRVHHEPWTLRHDSVRVGHGHLDSLQGAWGDYESRRWSMEHVHMELNCIE